METDKQCSALHQALVTRNRITSDLGDLIVDGLPAEHLPDLYNIVTEEATAKKRRERPNAADEFPAFEVFEEFATSGYVVTLTQVDTHIVVGYGFVTPSLINRCMNPLLADLRILLVGVEPSEKLLRDLYGYLVELSSSIGYRACIIDTFSTNPMTIAAASALGFHTRCFIPLCGLVPGQGLTECFIMYKSLTAEALPDPTDPSVIHLPEKRYRITKRRNTKLSLPVRTPLPDGTQITISHTEESEIPVIQKFLGQAIARGQGYGTSDPPPFELLQAVCRGEDSSHLFTVSSAGSIVGFMYLTPSVLCRSYDPALTDVSIIVDDGFGGNGVGKFMAKMWQWLSHQLGYKGCASDTFISNKQILSVIREGKLRIVGCIPDGGHLNVKGWEDLVMFCKETFDDDPLYPVLSKL